MRSRWHLLLLFVLALLGQLAYNLFTGIGISPAMSQVPPTPVNSCPLVQPGREFYETGQFDKAQTAWESARDNYQSQKNKLCQAMALSNLSLTYQQQSRWTEAEQAINDSLQLLPTVLDTSNSPEQLPVLAQALNTRGKLELALGKAKEALETWRQADAIYIKVTDTAGSIRNQINQSQALQYLGYYLDARKTLLKAFKIDEQAFKIDKLDYDASKHIKYILQQPLDLLIKFGGLYNFGNVYLALGDYDDAKSFFDSSQKLANSLKSSQSISGDILLSLGNVERARSSRARALDDEQQAQESADKAIKLYQQAVDSQFIAHNTKIQSKLNQIGLLLETAQWLQYIESPAFPNWQSKINEWLAKFNLSQLLTPIPDVSPSSTRIYNQINLAQSLIRLVQLQITGAPSEPEITNLLRQTAQQARQLGKGDRRAESYTLGTLGNLYEVTKQWDKAETFTQQALDLSQQNIIAPDLYYRWQWQMGRIYKEQNHIPEAISAYRDAVKTLKSLRNNLAGVNTEAQFSLRDNVEPVYRDLVALLLPPEETHPNQKQLEESLYYIESLQLAELENFLQCNLADVRTVQINRVIAQDDPTEILIKQINQVLRENQTVALIFPIILKTQVSVIVKLPGQDNLLYHVTPNLNEKAVIKKLKKLHYLLGKPIFDKEGENLSEEVYNWLILPFIDQLYKNKIKSLVFVLDGYLRDIPMAALYDGKEYLVQKNFTVALIPTVQILEAQKYNLKRFKILFAGVTKEHPPEFGANPLVQEQANIIKKIRNDSDVLLDPDFSKNVFKDKLSSSLYNIIHLAAHGQFGSSYQTTYILSGDGKININELRGYLENRNQNKGDAIQLLVLSACETAKGNNRTALGIAGVAVKSGAHSTIAPLWFADQDSTTILIEKFYTELVKNQKSPAEALHLAQKALLEDPDSSYEAPRHWASFVLVVDWL